MRKEEEEKKSSSKKKEQNCSVVLVLVHGRNPEIRYKSKRQFQIVVTSNTIV